MLCHFSVCCAFRVRWECLSISFSLSREGFNRFKWIDGEVLISLSTSFRMIILLLKTKFEVFKSIIIRNECSFWRCLTRWFSNNTEKQENFVRICEKPMIIIVIISRLFYHCSNWFTRYDTFLMNIQIRQFHKGF